MVSKVRKRRLQRKWKYQSSKQDKSFDKEKFKHSKNDISALASDVSDKDATGTNTNAFSQSQQLKKDKENNTQFTQVQNCVTKVNSPLSKSKQRWQRNKERINISRREKYASSPGMKTRKTNYYQSKKI